MQFRHRFVQPLAWWKEPFFTCRPQLTHLGPPPADAPARPVPGSSNRSVPWPSSSPLSTPRATSMAPTKLLAL